jgi:hypothetical protein
LIVMLVLVALCGRYSLAQGGEGKRMGAIDIFEGLLSHSAAQRDRAANELPLMDEDTARLLGAEVQRADMREGETCLKALANADCINGALATCIVFDSDDVRLRQAALDALCAMSPGRAFDGAATGMTEKRIAAITSLIKESDYMQLQCEGLLRLEDNVMVPPVEEALRLSVLLDRLLGVRAMPLVLNRLADFMLGDQHDEAEKSPTRRVAIDRLRRGAAMWFQAIWIADPATRFNYSPTAPWAERKKSITRMRATLADLEKREVELDPNRPKFTGVRLGDHMWTLAKEDDLVENKAAAIIRLQWWRGDEIVVAGPDYAAAVDAYNAKTGRERGMLLRELRDWWFEHRQTTESK